jgi:cobalt/nickel transport system permease protein
MHIPDGYLGPATFITLFLVMMVIWFFAFRNGNKNLGPRNVPMLSFMAALSFILMMFNLPIPDGTTAHMVGAVLIAIVLGPYGATIALSIALLIQALLFGDGGITAYGANVFNMGVVMPFTGIFVYIAAKKALEGRKSKIFGSESRKRAIAGFAAGYIGIVIAAVTAAVEFGIQPTIAPGYAPYGLDLAIPAMLGAHLLVGIAEGLTTAIVVYYISENRSDLLNLPKFCPRWLDKYMEKGPEPTSSGSKIGNKMPAETKGGE